MRRDGSHFFTTSYPLCTPLSPSLSFHSLSLRFLKDCYICSMILYTPLSWFHCIPLSLSTSYKVHLSLHYMVSVVLWSFYLQSKHRGLCCSPHHADGSEMMAEMLLFSRCCSESHFPGLLKRSLKLTGSTRREKSCLIVMQKHFPPPSFGRERFFFPLWLGWSFRLFHIRSARTSLYLSTNQSI